MKHSVIIDKLPEGFIPGDMQPFYIVRQEKMALREDGIFVTRMVGVRCAGYFAYSGGAAEEAEEALKYGLMTAQFRLCTPGELDLAPLLKERKNELIQAANDALAESESPYRIDALELAWADTCVHENEQGGGAQRYSGFVMGQNGMHNITVSEPKGVPGEWQCVCGAYSAPGDECEKCGLKRPVF